jgi:hypothetical protein
MRSFLTVFLLSAFINGCGNHFAPDRNVKEALADDDVIGRWKMTTKSLGLFARDGFRSEPAQTYTITFHKDGTCVFHSIEHSASAPKGTYILASGVWKLAHDVKRGANVMVKNAVQTELNVGGTTVFRDWDFTREDGVLMLWDFYGDPDQWEFIEYAHDG